MVREPNLKEDKFISRKEVGILIEGMPSFYFRDGKMYNDSVVRYNTELYVNDKGEEYYIFRELDYCTLPIMNCNKEIYKEISKIIKLNNDISIFIPMNNEEDTENFIIIPFEYRHTEGIGCNRIVDIE
ncbi:hypothetical protein [Clostridium baratii]|uniref:hypothetical protein n=1 Tax=Clostridium baratii TaxID=1561 RepID=UPI0006BB203A|nr:hypothetical protein [Clostridium baratii]